MHIGNSGKKLKGFEVPNPNRAIEALYKPLSEFLKQGVAG